MMTSLNIGGWCVPPEPPDTTNVNHEQQFLTSRVQALPSAQLSPQDPVLPQTPVPSAATLNTDQNGSRINASVPQHRSASGDFTLADIKIPGKGFEIVGETQLQVGLGRPSQNTFVRANPDPKYVIDTYIVDVGDSGNGVYLPSQQLWGDLQEEPSFSVRRLMAVITAQGGISIMVLKLPNAGGRGSSWSESLLALMEEAKSRWLRICANHGNSRYEGIYAVGNNLTEPKWPDIDFEKMLNLAFRDRRITSLSHPVLRRLRGEIV